MSNISTFKGGASKSTVGYIFAGINTEWGSNVTIAGSEYLRTGTLKAYTSNYLEVANSAKFLCFSNVANANVDWTLSSGSNPRLFNLGGNNFLVGYGTNDLKRGTLFNNTPTQESPTSVLTPVTGSIYDSFIFNDLLVFLLGSSSYNGNRGHIVTNPGTSTYTERTARVTGANGYYIGYTVGAASNSLAVAMASFFDSNDSLTNKIVTSTNGTTWTNRTPSVTDITPVILTYSSIANAFVMVSNTGAIYTTTDGYTLTSRTAPSGMPTSVDVSNIGQNGFSASSANSTLIAVGFGKLLKITGLTDYSIIDISSIIGSSSGNFARIIHDGTKFVLAKGSGDYALAESTDEGVTWDRKFNVYNANYANSFVTFAGLSYANSKYYAIRSSPIRPLDVTSVLTSNTPDLIGSLSIRYFDPTVQAMPAYYQIK